MSTETGHKRRVRQAFDRAAGRYDDAAVVQREICARLAAFARAHPCRRAVERVLDAGCGTGYALGLLRAAHPGAELLAVDFAPAMLARVATSTRLCADLERLPLRAACIDALWSSLAVQWCTPTRALTEIARVLRPGGCAWLATLGPATLHELRTAFRTVDTAEHVLHFHDASVWAQAARSAGLRVAAIDQGPSWARAADLRTLLGGIKAIGAHGIGSAPRQPLGRAGWRTLEAAYERWRDADGLLPASYDVILLAVEKPT